MRNIWLVATGRSMRRYEVSEDTVWTSSTAPGFSKASDINLVITNGATLSFNANNYPNLKRVTFEGLGGSAAIRGVTARSVTVVDRSDVVGGCQITINGEDTDGDIALKNLTFRRVGGVNPGGDAFNNAQVSSNCQGTARIEAY